MKAENMKPNSTCLNCEQPITDKFCAHCGQKHIAGPLTVSYFIKTFISALTNSDTRIFRTFKGLFLNPGHVAKQYALGKRQHFVNPLRLCIVIISSYLALLVFSGGIISLNESEVLHQASFNETEQKNLSEFGKTWREVYMNHRIFIYLGALPFAALILKYSFYKSGYNYISTLILLLYTSALYSVYGIVMVSVFKAFDINYFSQYRRLVEGGIGLIVFFQAIKSFYDLQWVKALLFTCWAFLSLFLCAYLAAFISTVLFTAL